MSNTTLNTTTFAVRDQKQERAIVLLHGFGGEAHTTFGMMPAFLAGDPALYGWDIHCFGYPTALRPDVTGVWAADPNLTILAGFLTTALVELRFREYKRLALVGHSMGGLVIQRALLDGDFVRRVSHVVLFGTPSNGLKKAGLLRLFKRQARDMDADGEFVPLLRNDWKRQIGARPPFVFRAVAGIRDEFVPSESSVEVFPREYRSYVNGNHLEMVKPSWSAADSMELLGHLFTNQAHAVPSPPPAPARNPSGMSESEVEQFAYLLEAQGRDSEALDLLNETRERSTNLMGVLAGRLKRRWLADGTGHAAEGEQARALYGAAYERAAAAGDHAQAFYHGINDAFLTLALRTDTASARTIAGEVLGHVALAREARWARATEGEAHLYLGNRQAALQAYEEAAKQGWTPRELDSLQRQAIWAARLMDDEESEGKLELLFRSVS